MQVEDRMGFEKRLKIRFATYTIFVVVGLLVILLSAFGVLKNDIFISWGTIIFVMGAAKLVQYKRINSSESLKKKRKIAETDERNITLWKEARSITFIYTIYVAAITVAVLYAMHKPYEASIISYFVCAMVLIYWIVYAIIKRKI